MATSWAPWLLQAFDNYGDVLNGGKVYSYAAGTSTPLATYQDLAGATPNANPVILDSAGRADIRVTNGVAYKLVIQTSAGVELDSKDNMTVGTVAGSSTSTMLVNMTFVGTPAAQGYMGGNMFDRSVTFPVNWSGARGDCQTNPGSTYLISIQKNDIEVGTASVATTGVFTFATTGGTTVAFVSGDKLTFIAPSSVGTIADICLTLAGVIA